MKGSTIMSESILTGFSIVISFILIVLVVRVVISQQTDKTYKSLFESIAKDITFIIDRSASMSGSGKSEYELPKDVKSKIRIDYKTVFVTYDNKTVKKSFSGLLNSGPYIFYEPEILCFVKDGEMINIFEGSCDDYVKTITTTTTTTLTDYTSTTISPPGNYQPPEYLFRGLYVMGDHWRAQTDWNSMYPALAPIGSWGYWGWDQVEISPGLYDFSMIQDFLDTTQSLGKPASISIIIAGGDETTAAPEWVPSISYDGKDFPAWSDVSYKNQFRNMVLALGNDVKDHPNLNSVWITSGRYGENYCTVGSRCGGFQEFVSYTVDVYKEAFPNKFLFSIVSGEQGRNKVIQKAELADGSIGLKFNRLSYDNSAACSYSRNLETGELETNQEGYIQVINNVNSILAIGWEHAYATNQHQTYWSIMCGLSHRIDVLDLGERQDDPNKRFFDQVRDVKLIDGSQLSSFFKEHLGKDVSKTSDVWIMLRETSFPHYAKIGSEGYSSGEYGDWEFFLERPDGISKATTQPLISTPDAYNDGTPDVDLGLMANHYPEDFINLWRVGYREFNEMSFPGIYAEYSIRRTDIANGNDRMYFKVDDRYPPKANQESGYVIRVMYYHIGPEELYVEYKDDSGTIRQTEKKKGNDGWTYVDFEVDSAFSNDLLGGTDFAVVTENADAYIHMIRVWGSSKLG